MSIHNKKLFKKIKKHYRFIVLVFLLAIGFFFAFYKYPARYVLEDETVRDAIVGIEGAAQLQFPLVGAFSSTGPYTFGPLFFYQLIIFSFISPTLYAPWIYMGLVYLLSILVLYKIGEELEGKDFGLILALLGTFSPA